MARPLKKGIPYFPLDVDIDQDDKIQLIEADFGLKGFAIVIKLFCKIYKENGYYYQWDEKERRLFANRLGITGGLVDDVVNGCIKWGLFNKDLFDKFKILTSAAIQERYLKAIGRREKVEIYSNLTLIDINVYRNAVKVDNNPLNVDDNTQSKVKKSIVKQLDTNVSVETEVSPVVDPKVIYSKTEKTKQELFNFIKIYKPQFAEPYVDYWNMFTQEFPAPRVALITEKRRKKIAARSKERGFDFNQILRKANQSTLLKESTWFTFDWVVNSADNYTKLLEGNYDDKAKTKEPDNNTVSQATMEMLNASKQN